MQKDSCRCWSQHIAEASRGLLYPTACERMSMGVKKTHSSKHFTAPYQQGELDDTESYELFLRPLQTNLLAWPYHITSVGENRVFSRSPIPSFDLRQYTCTRYSRLRSYFATSAAVGGTVVASPTVGSYSTVALNTSHRKFASTVISQQSTDRLQNSFGQVCVCVARNRSCINR